MHFVSIENKCEREYLSQTTGSLLSWKPPSWFKTESNGRTDLDGHGYLLLSVAISVNSMLFIAIRAAYKARAQDCIENRTGGAPTAANIARGTDDAHGAGTMGRPEWWDGSVQRQAATTSQQIQLSFLAAWVAAQAMHCGTFTAWPTAALQSYIGDVR